MFHTLHVLSCEYCERLFVENFKSLLTGTETAIGKRAEKQGWTRFWRFDLEDEKCHSYLVCPKCLQEAKAHVARGFIYATKKECTEEKRRFNAARNGD